ncbi:MAG: hypothetical protein MI924_22505 [Chloroflexales bacterium]|nr:hypothetical protein [Chloroflexales bacterium]
MDLSQPHLLDRVRQALRVEHYATRTSDADAAPRRLRVSAPRRLRLAIVRAYAGAVRSNTTMRLLNTARWNAVKEVTLSAVKGLTSVG